MVVFIRKTTVGPPEHGNFHPFEAATTSWRIPWTFGMGLSSPTHSPLEMRGRGVWRSGHNIAVNGWARIIGVNCQLIGGGLGAGRDEEGRQAGAGEKTSRVRASRAKLKGVSRGLLFMDSTPVQTWGEHKHSLPVIALALAREMKLERVLPS